MRDGLTRLGVLLLSSAADRRALGTAPLVQAIKYDEQGQKINKWAWDDCALGPVELVDAVWREVPDFRESYEVAEGMFRRNVPAYDEKDRVSLNVPGNLILAQNPILPTPSSYSFGYPG